MNDNWRDVVAIFAALAVAWVAVILLAPWLPVPAAGVVYVLGGRLCHQIAERSFHLDGAQLPVCARCVGIYMGAAVGLWLVVLPGRPRLDRGTRRDPAYVRRVILIAAILNVLTLGSASNPVRAAAGLVLGLAVALAIRTVDYEEWPLPRRITSALPDARI